MLWEKTIMFNWLQPVGVCLMLARLSGYRFNTLDRLYWLALSVNLEIVLYWACVQRRQSLKIMRHSIKWIHKEQQFNFLDMPESSQLSVSCYSCGIIKQRMWSMKPRQNGKFSASKHPDWYVHGLVYWYHSFI